MKVIFNLIAIHSCPMRTWVETWTHSRHPTRRGFVGTVEVPKKKGDDVVEYAFEWHDINSDDEDALGFRLRW